MNFEKKCALIKAFWEVQGGTQYPAGSLWHEAPASAVRKSQPSHEELVPDSQCINIRTPGPSINAAHATASFISWMPASEGWDGTTRTISCRLSEVLAGMAAAVHSPVKQNKIHNSLGVTVFARF